MLAIFYYTWRCRNIKDLQTNEDIRASKVRLIDKDGEQLGIVSIHDALDKAFDEKLDLVNVAPTAKPPVCRIMDYGKYKYDLVKKEKEAKKKQRIINVKEVRLSPNIDDHDLEVKANRAKEFLKNQDRVKVSVKFRGRELGHTELGVEVLAKFTDLVKEFGKVDKKPNMEGRNMIMFLGPIPEKD